MHKFTALFLLLLISGCATQSTYFPDKTVLHNTNENSESKQNQLLNVDDETQEQISQEEFQEPPLFTTINPTIDPIMWTNETEADAITPPDGEPVIIGRLPGQRELPFELFEEAAVPHNMHQPGTIIFRDPSGPDDIWQRIRSGFELPHQQHPRITANINWYANHQQYLNRTAIRAERYLHLIVEEAERANVPLELALLPVVESAFQPFAYSHGRASGIWQFIPGTGKLYGLKQNWWYDGRRDIVASTRAAIKLLTDMKEAFNDDWLLALAAYNSGWGTVSKAILKNKRQGKPTTFWDLDLPKETEDYVPKLLAIAEIVNNPQKYGIDLKPIVNLQVVTEVETGSQIDLALAAELAEISIEELYILNPAYNRWATDPKGPHKLLLPLDKQEIFTKNLAALPEDQRISWQRHTIKKGESLQAIANQYHTTVALIKELNNIRNNKISQGQSLIIPVSSRSDKTYALSQEQRLIALQNTQQKGQEKISYEVKSGDTLWTISRKYKVNYRSLAQWNGLAPKDTLRLGQNLVIWTKGKPIQQAAFSPHSTNLTTQKINYRVRNGDSLARISQKFKVEIDDLKKWNKILTKQKYLKPGQQLTLYIDVTTQGS